MDVEVSAVEEAADEVVVIAEEGVDSAVGDEVAEEDLEVVGAVVASGVEEVAVEHLAVDEAEDVEERRP